MANTSNQPLQPGHYDGYWVKCDPAGFRTRADVVCFTHYMKQRKIKVNYLKFTQELYVRCYNSATYNERLTGKL